MNAEPEASFKQLHEAGDHSALAGALVEQYGAELLGYMQAIIRDEDAAQDAFQAFCMDLLRGLPNFRGDASFRTWLYVLARHRAAKRGREPQGTPLSRSPEVERLVAKTRSQTAPHLRTEVKNSVRRLQAKLSEDERTLLILRVDRDMAWDDIARVLGEGEPSAADTARIRKRFQRTKNKLRALAREAGLIPEGDDREPR